MTLPECHQALGYHYDGHKFCQQCIKINLAPIVVHRSSKASRVEVSIGFGICISPLLLLSAKFGSQPSLLMQLIGGSVKQAVPFDTGRDY